jgi:hypothetical protein
VKASNAHIESIRSLQGNLPGEYAMQSANQASNTLTTTTSMSKKQLLLTGELANALLLSTSEKIARKQLTFVQEANLYFGLRGADIETRVSWFNALPEETRKNIKLLNCALQGSRAYNTHRVQRGLSVREFINRLKALEVCSDLRVYSRSKLNHKTTDGSMSLLTWIALNLEYLNTTSPSYFHFVVKLFNDVSQVKSKDFDSQEVKALKEINFSRWHLMSESEVTRVLEFKDTSAIYRLNDFYSESVLCAIACLQVIKCRRESNRQEIMQNNPNTLTLKERVNIALEKVSVSGVSPLNWFANFTPTEVAIANKFRPSGSCLGIELEFVAEKSSKITNWDEEEFPSARFLTFKGDGSINAQNDQESLARYQELNYFMNPNSPSDWKDLQDCLKYMTDNGARVNSSCGNHVHIDMRGKTSQQASRIAGKIRNALKDWAHRTLHHNRAYNQYCGVFREHTNNKYTAVNTLPFRRFGTIEVRVGMATLNFYKLKLWTEFLQYMASPGASIETFDDFMQSDCPSYIKVWIFGRIRKFHKSYEANGKGDIIGISKWEYLLSGIDGGVE